MQRFKLGHLLRVCVSVMHTKERNERFPSGLEAFFVIVALFAAEYLVGAAVRDGRSVFGLDRQDFDVLAVLLGNGILFVALMQYKHLSYRSLFHSSRNSVVATVSTLSVPVLLIVPALFLSMAVVLSVLTSLVPLSRWEEAMFDRMMSNGVASIVIVCILAPVLEEMLFRGIILRSFLNQYSRWRAIFGSAALFGLAHLNIYQFAVGFVVGTISGWIYERARSLWPCILLHAAYNIAGTLLYLSGNSAGEQDIRHLSPVVWALLFVVAAAGAALLRLLLASDRGSGLTGNSR